MNTEQKKIIEDSISKIEEKKRFLYSLQANAGSGKTYTLINMLQSLYKKEKNKNLKILCLSFNRDVNEEFKKKIKALKLSDNVQSYTVHGFFNKFTENGKYEKDYEQSIFTTKIIKKALEYMKIGDISKGQIREKKLFEPDIKYAFLSEKDIKNRYLIKYLTAFMNVYYTSIIKHSSFDIEKIEKKISFFEKKATSYKDIEISEQTKKFIDNFIKVVARKNLTEDDKDFLKKYKFFIKNIEDTKTIKFVKENKDDVKKIFLYMLTKNFIKMTKDKFLKKIGEKKDEVIIEIYGKDEYGRDVLEEIKTEINNIPVTKFESYIKVPHIYYYRDFVEKSFKKEFLDIVTQDYDYILVDEAQDNDILFANFLINLITLQDKIKGFLLVGDENQSIYSFRSPGYINLLTFIKKTKFQNILKENGIDFAQYYLTKSYRFGDIYAKGLNEIFDKEKKLPAQLNMKGIEDKDSYFYLKKTLNLEEIETVFEKIQKYKKNAVILTRSNSEALILNKKLKKITKVSSSIKKEIKKFILKGSEAISDVVLKEKLSDIFGKDKVSFSEIIENGEAIELLSKNGYRFLKMFNMKELLEIVEINNNKIRKNIPIMTVHSSKGLEFDYVFIAKDFFKNDEELIEKEKEEVSSNYSDIDIDRKLLNMIEDGGTIIPVFFEEEEKGEEKAENSQIENGLNEEEEERIFYVALTRAKKGTFFLEGGEHLLERVNSYVSGDIKNKFKKFYEKDGVFNEHFFLEKKEKDDNNKKIRL